MATDICFLHFRIHDSTLSSTSTATTTSTINNNNNNATTSTDTTRQSSVVAKAGLHEWLCQLSILDDKTTVRGLLGPLVDNELKKAAALASCCTLQVATGSYDPTAPTSTTDSQVLYAKTIQSEDLFRQGVEFYMDKQDVLVDHHYYEFTLILSSLHIKLLGPPDGPQETHTLALSESDPVARNVDPLVEMMTQFQRHNATADVEFRFIDHNGHARETLRAHQAILSIYPIFSEKMVQAQSNPYQRSKKQIIVIELPVETFLSFLTLLGFIYSGKLPNEAFNPRDTLWKQAFDLAKEYGLDRSLNSAPWMEWHRRELEQVMTDENVLEIYFVWGYQHEEVARMCVDHVNDRQHVQYQGREFHGFVQEMIKGRFMGKPGCREFQDALVNRGLNVYAHQQYQRYHSMFSPSPPFVRLRQRQQCQQRQQRPRQDRSRH
ncbi:hypothetical protein BGX33_007549 [Mortierella sp. NVP41]|nr:hypothetical protein BGX33_007549 [Mortierella sp. NVP41]